MIRPLFLSVLIVTSCSAASTASAQLQEINVRLLSFAEFPLLIERDDVNYPSTLSEYRLFAEWYGNPYHNFQSPTHFDLVAIVENDGAVPIGPIELELKQNLKVGEFFEPSLPMRPPYPIEHAEWEGSVSVETTTIRMLDGKTASFVWFGPFSSTELLQQPEDKDRWPWEVKYEVNARCNNCIPASATVSFTMWHAL